MKRELVAHMRTSILPCREGGLEPAPLHTCAESDP